jgi:hypothetical protein
LNFAPGNNDKLVAGPNPRTISNVIAGGTGANGQNGQTTDPVVSAWLYVFGQFVDHDLDLEETPTNSSPTNITVPKGVLLPLRDCLESNIEIIAKDSNATVLESLPLALDFPDLESLCYQFIDEFRDNRVYSTDVTLEFRYREAA